MTDQVRTPTTESIVAEIDALAIEYPDFDHAPFAIVGQGLLRRIRAALLAAEQREQALREMLTREEHLVGAARSVLSNYENEDGVIPYAKVIDDMRFLAIAVSSEPPATGE